MKTRKKKGETNVVRVMFKEREMEKRGNERNIYL